MRFYARANVLLAFVFGIVIAVFAVQFFPVERARSTNSEFSSPPVSKSYAERAPVAIASRGNEYKDAIVAAMTARKSKNDDGRTAFIGVTSHHLPTALIFIADFYAAVRDSAGSRNVFVIVGPDHFERCATQVSTTKLPFETPFGKLYPDTPIIETLLKHGVDLDDHCFDGEHSIGVQTLFIKYLNPDAMIVPLIFSASTNTKRVESIADALVPFSNSITIIVSTDFSHYQDYTTAEKIDSESSTMMRSMNVDALALKHIDSPASLRLAIVLAKKLNLQPRIIGHANSFDFTGQRTNTTSYFNVLFER